MVAVDCSMQVRSCEWSAAGRGWTHLPRSCSDKSFISSKCDCLERITSPKYHLKREQQWETANSGTFVGNQYCIKFHCIVTTVEISPYSCPWLDLTTASQLLGSLRRSIIHHLDLVQQLSREMGHNYNDICQRCKKGRRKGSEWKARKMGGRQAYGPRPLFFSGSSHYCYNRLEVLHC